MCARKQTPDILAEIMEGIASPTEADKLAELATIPPAVKKRPAPKAAKPVIKTMPEKPAPRPVEKPAKYEYMLISFQDYKGWRPQFIDGREIVDWMRGPLVHQYLAELGEDGWELAAASAGEPMYGTNDKRQLFFKRIKTL